MQGCNTRARGSLRRHIRGKPVERARRKARATAGTHSGRGRPPARPMCRGDSKRLGARGSAWPCVSEVAAAVRGRFQLKNWSRARACQCILELCEWFRDCSQASGASQRVQRASAPRPTGLRCGWPCTAWPTARPQPGSCFAEYDRCALASLLGFTPLPVRCALGPASHESQRAARRAWPAGALRDGVDSLCADWRRCAPWERGVSGSGGACACSRERADARATPTHLIHCARTCCSQRGSVRVARAAMRPLSWARRCARVSRRLVARSVALRVVRVSLGIVGRRARLGRLPG